MAMLSYILLALATVGACLSAARIPVMTGPFALSVAGMVAGVVLMRRAYRARLAREISEDSGETFDFVAVARMVLNALSSLEERPEAGCEEIHVELDKLVDGPLFDFAMARNKLLAMHGFGGFARIVGEFSRGERAVNRAWSAAVDGYPQEARDYVTRAGEIFTGLVGELEKLEMQSSSA